MSTARATLTFEVPGRPLSLNAVSGSSHWQASVEKKYWRSAAKTVARRAGQLQPPIDVEVTMRTTGRLFDHISPALAVKAATDGIIDAGVIPDDAPKYVRRLVLNAPTKFRHDSLVIVLREVTDDAE